MEKNLVNIKNKNLKVGKKCLLFHFYLSLGKYNFTYNFAY